MNDEPCKTIVRKILIDPAELERLRNVEKAAEALREVLISRPWPGVSALYDALAAYEIAREGVCQ
jgi:hypothetical protein